MNLLKQLQNNGVQFVKKLVDSRHLALVRNPPARLKLSYSRPLAPARRFLLKKKSVPRRTWYVEVEEDEGSSAFNSTSSKTRSCFFSWYFEDKVLLLQLVLNLIATKTKMNGRDKPNVLGQLYGVIRFQHVREVLLELSNIFLCDGKLCLTLGSIPYLFRLERMPLSTALLRLNSLSLSMLNGQPRTRKCCCNAARADK